MLCLGSGFGFQAGGDDVVEDGEEARIRSNLEVILERLIFFFLINITRATTPATAANVELD